MTVRQYVEQRLTKMGYTNIEWKDGRFGYYCLALSKYHCTVCIGLKDFIDDLMYIEEQGKIA